MMQHRFKRGQLVRAACRIQTKVGTIEKGALGTVTSLDVCEESLYYWVDFDQISNGADLDIDGYQLEAAGLYDYIIERGPLTSRIVTLAIAMSQSCRDYFTMCKDTADDVKPTIEAYINQETMESLIIAVMDGAYAYVSDGQFSEEDGRRTYDNIIRNFHLAALKHAALAGPVLTYV